MVLGAPPAAEPEAVWTEDLSTGQGVCTTELGVARPGQGRAVPPAVQALREVGRRAPAPASSPAVLRLPHTHLIFRSLSLFSLSRFLRMRMNWLKKCSWSFRF